MIDQMILAIYVTASWMKIWNIYYNSIFNTSISIYIYIYIYISPQKLTDIQEILT